MDRQQEFVLRTIEERDIRFVRLWFTDVLGTLKSVAVAPAELEGAFAEGIGFDGSAIEGFARVYEADMLAKPDPATFQVLPWRGESPGTARMFCDLPMPDGTPSMADPRHVLQRALRQGRATWASPSTPTPRSSSSCSSRAGCRASAPSRSTRPATSTTCRTATATTSAAPRSPCSRRWASRWSSATTRARPGQNEIDLRYADALSTADNIMTFRTVIKEVALEQGIFATFMPKPFAEHPGLGHAHPPLALRGRHQRVPRARRALPAVARPVGSSSPACCTTAPRSRAVTNQWVNSYKRLWGGGEAPAHLTWGHNNRSAMVRVPMYKPSKGNSRRRVEVRSLDARATPTSRSRCCSPPASRASRRATSCRRRPRTTSGA